MKFLKKFRWPLLLAALALSLTAVGGSLAWLLDQPASAENRLSPGRVPNTVEEDIEDGVKNNVRITNTGNVDAYIRAALVFTWVDDAGNVSSDRPRPGVDFSWDLQLDGWKQGADGFYYHLRPVDPGASTGVLFTNCQAGEKKGFRLSAEILGQSVQALGLDETGTPPAVKNWDSVTGIGDDRTLLIKEAAA